MKPVTIVIGLFVLLVVAALGLFGWQNLQTQVDLVLNLGPIGGWYIAKAFPVPYLMGICLGAGFLGAFIWLGGKSLIASRKAKGLERQVSALKDEIEWGRRNVGSPSKSAVAAPAKKAKLAVKPAAKPAVPVAAPAPKPAPPAAAELPDFDDLI
jgi:hypothetical protein